MRRGISGFAALVMGAFLLAGCATTPPPEGAIDPAAYNDPYQPVNRAIFNFNYVVDGLVLKPAATIYGGVVPSPIRTGVSNVLNNLTAPVIFFNDLFQGERDRAGVTLGRFMINSTVGVLGIFDPATALGYPRHTEDFGKTLGRYGVNSGPYVVLPLLGPSNGRDAVGTVIDFLIDPFGYFAPTSVWVPQLGVNVVATRQEALPLTNDLEANSLDLYAATRSIFTQNREAAIRQARSGTAAAAPATDKSYEDIFNEPE